MDGYQEAKMEILAKIPAPPVPWWAARAGRWVARIFGSLLALFMLAMAIGEGMPSPWSGDVSS
jgi:hypothetical protein